MCEERAHNKQVVPKNVCEKIQIISFNSLVNTQNFVYKKHKASYAIGFPCIYSGFRALLLKKLDNFWGQPIDIRQKPKNKARSEIYHRFEDPARLKLFAPHNL